MVQNADGGWGETCAATTILRCVGVDQHAFADGMGHSGLLSAGDTRSDSVAKGIKMVAFASADRWVLG